MAGKIGLVKGQIKIINEHVDNLFEKVMARYLGPGAVRDFGDKRIMVSYKPELTLQHLYGEAAQEERSSPHVDVMESLANIAKGYLEATAASTKAQVAAVVDKALREADANGVDTDLDTVLTGHLNEIWGKATTEVKKILNTEATHARNLGAYEGIAKVSASFGIDDPVVYFVSVNDDSRCKECTRLHCLPDGVTPRLWLMSEVGAGYHKRGQDNPKIGGLHPNERCSLATLAPGYTFDRSGGVKFVKLDHLEFPIQREEYPKL